MGLQDVANTPPKYEARVFIGPDTLAGRALAHWLDNFGAVYSVPPASTIRLDAADGAGGWKRFAQYRAARHRDASP
jgi:hypothetical protein